MCKLCGNIEEGQLLRTLHREGEFELCLKDKIKYLLERKEIEKAFQAKAAA